MTTNHNDQSIQIVKTWFDKAKSGVESHKYFDGFISLWVSFNCFFVAEFYSEAKTQSRRSEPSERDYLKIIYTKQEYETKYLELLNNQDFRNKINKFYNYLNGESYIVHFKGKVADMRPNHQTESKAQPFENINNFEQFIMVVYQIRCNLFHGNKSPHNDGDVQLVESIFETFLMFIEKIYNFEGYLC